MARPHYISLAIAGIKADIDPEGQVPTISYALEDEQDFEVKRSADSFDIELPATLFNDQIHNTLYDPSIIDKTGLQVYDNFRPCIYMANGAEVLIGQYLVQRVRMKDGRPQKYFGKIYGLNGDWVIALKEKTLLDFVNPNNHLFTATTIQESWNYDGRNENLDYVYAPVRYLKAFGPDVIPTDTEPTSGPQDDNVLVNDMKPAISPYWILYRGFKSVGYRIVSTFMDTDYYRKGVLPWTWGGFDFLDDSRWEPLKFLAGQKDSLRLEGDHDDEFPDLQVLIDPANIPGTYENTPGLYQYTTSGSTLPFMMMWSYPTAVPPSLGKVRMSFSVTIAYGYKAVQQQDDVSMYVFWYYNGDLAKTEPVFSGSGGGVDAPFAGGSFGDYFFELDMNPGDWVGCRIRVHTFQSLGGFARVDTQVEQFQLDFVKLTDGSFVNLTNYPKFKKYNWLDFLRGEIDLFDLSIQTDPVKKEVYIEPTHAYTITSGGSGGGAVLPPSLSYTQQASAAPGGGFDYRMFLYVGPAVLQGYIYHAEFTSVPVNSVQFSMNVEYVATATDTQNSVTSNLRTLIDNALGPNFDVQIVNDSHTIRIETHTATSVGPNFFASVNVFATSPQVTPGGEIVQHYPGYYNRKQLDWSQKVDISKDYDLELFSDYEREIEFKFKPDTNDGGLKKVQDRNQATIGMAKYVLPPRYKTQKKEKENRFYSAVMHYNHDKFKSITGVSPQLIALIPENVANTSGPESENTFEPKRAWYKGNIDGVGGWRFNGIEQAKLPYMFAVNYKPGGHNDPVLSYSDQLIGGNIGIGLLKKFFLQRMAIFRGGRRYNPIEIMLENKDVTNFLHRESIIIENMEFLLTSIRDYNPVEPESTSCGMWMFMPMSTVDRDQTFPSISNIRTGTANSSFDIKFWPHQLLTTDVPT